MNGSRAWRSCGAVGVGVLIAAQATLALAAEPAACRSESAGLPPKVVELYTSEGCSSCPPADRWLSERAHDPSVVALAFHVDYWDRLGWKDRFGDAAFTDRQARGTKTNGARFSYTPQVVVDGRDQPDWPALNGKAWPAAAPASRVDAQLVRTGSHVEATVRTEARASDRLAGYWAVTEDGHASKVGAGENSGATLRHDRVVRLYRPVAAWSADAAEPHRFDLDTAALPADPSHKQRVVFVVTDATSGRPLQAVQLGC